MITETRISQSAQKLLAIIEELQAHPHVQTAVLCTEEGLPVHGKDSKTHHIAAVAGFLLSAAKQSSNMLGHATCQEISVELSDDAILICHPFVAGATELILAVLLKQKSAYKRLIMQTISTIQEAVEE